MARLIGRACLVSLALLLVGTSAPALMIDDFGDGALNFVPANTTQHVQFSQASGIILGGDREESITNDAGSPPASFIAVGAGGGNWAYGSIFNAVGTALLTWDGDDGAPPGLDPTGLGGADFTEGAMHTAIAISIQANDFPADITLTVYTSAANFSTFTVATPGSAGTLQVLFADFVDAGISGGADFSDVGAFTLLVDGLSEPQLDLSFDSIQTIVPEPSTALLLGLGLLGLAIQQGRLRKR